jgi:hypothetical protein
VLKRRGGTRLLTVNQKRMVNSVLTYSVKRRGRTGSAGTMVRVEEQSSTWLAEKNGL